MRERARSTGQSEYRRDPLRDVKTLSRFVSIAEWHIKEMDPIARIPLNAVLAWLESGDQEMRRSGAITDVLLSYPPVQDRCRSEDALLFRAGGGFLRAELRDAGDERRGNGLG